MKKGDWYGLIGSLVLHGLLLLGFFFISTAAQPVNVGFVEVEFGPISEGRPVKQTVEPVVEERVPEVEEEPEEEAPQPAVETEEEGKLVDLPDQPEPPEEEEEVVESPETEDVGIEQAVTASDTEEAGEARQNVDPEEGGDPEATAGADEGDEGTGVEEEKTAPYQLEGLENRTLFRGPLPNYAEKVNTTIRVRITVDPRGQVISVVPLRKGSPALEQAIIQALRTWRFSALQPNAPQESQNGMVTFRFRLQ